MAEHEQLERLTWDYVRSGWTVASQTVNSVVLEKGEQVVRLRIKTDGSVSVDGPLLPAVIFDGRARTWLTLLLILVVVFVVAWAAGFFR